MVLSFQSGHRSIRQHIPEPMARRMSQKKPEKIYVRKFELNEKETILQKTLIVFHALLAFLRETSRHQRLSLLHSSAFWCRNQGAEEVQEHGLPSAWRRTNVSVRLRTQNRRRKR